MLIHFCHLLGRTVSMVHAALSEFPSLVSLNASESIVKLNAYDPSPQAKREEERPYCYLSSS